MPNFAPYAEYLVDLGGCSVAAHGQAHSFSNLLAGIAG